MKNFMEKYFVYVLIGGAAILVGFAAGFLAAAFTTCALLALDFLVKWRIEVTRRKIARDWLQSELAERENEWKRYTEIRRAYEVALCRIAELEAPRKVPSREAMPIAHGVGGDGWEAWMCSAPGTCGWVAPIGDRRPVHTRKQHEKLLAAGSLKPSLAPPSRDTMCGEVPDEKLLVTGSPPSWEDMRGIAPDITDGVSIPTFLKKIRSGE